MMVLIAVAAVNFSYLRWYGIVGMLLGTRLIVVILQASLVCAMLSRDTARRFWARFRSFGVFALLGWFGVERWFPETADECFGDAMDAILQRIPLGGYNHLVIVEPTHAALAELLLTPPQLLIALSGGILVVVHHRRQGRAPFRGRLSARHPQPPLP
ncbi:MAG: hypothetical protein ACP5XB_03740 [Isosphaeraceae bacterium]